MTIFVKGGLQGERRLHVMGEEIGSLAKCQKGWSYALVQVERWLAQVEKGLVQVERWLVQVEKRLLQVETLPCMLSLTREKSSL